MSSLMDSVVAIILGGGRGTRLAPLTDYRSKPAVPLGGKYRLVDVPISNCINSGLFNIYVLTQYESASLNRHVAQTYTFDSFRGGFVEILAAEQSIRRAGWFQGTADAVRQTFHHTVTPATEHVAILSGDALYRMDYSDMLRQHLAFEADITIASKTVDAALASGFGVLKVDQGNRVVEFVEKPDGERLKNLPMDGETLQRNRLDPSKPYLASMGIYIFKKSVLAEYMERTELNDFGKDILPDAYPKRKVFVYPYDGYWEDIGTIKAFYEANLMLTDWMPKFSLYDARAPIYTRRRFLPGPKVLNCSVQHAIFADGAIVNAARVHRSLIGLRSIIRRGSTIENCIMMGADAYEEGMPKEPGSAQPAIQLGIGENCFIRNAILDLNVRIGNDVVIKNVHNRQEHEDELCAIRDGIVIIRKNSLIPHGTVI
jgi:glucose-1-phosphate adenylyltransferase